MSGRDLRLLFRETLAEYFRGFASEVETSEVETRACPDQYVGQVGANGYRGCPGTNDFECRRPPEPGRDRDPIILVLESPHKREYPPRQTPRPANGTTGTHIRRHLQIALCKLDLSALRPLILVNAIQHQCSAGVIPRAHRDELFQRMWQKRCVKDDFSRRLREYIGSSENFQVVNACTQGKCSPELWRLVEEKISTTLGRCSHLSIPHPGSWIRRRGAAVPVIRPRT